MGVDGFRSLRLRWIKPRCAVRGCGRQAGNERINQNIGIARWSHLSGQRLGETQTPAFDAAYADSVGGGNSAARDTRLITRP